MDQPQEKQPVQMGSNPSNVGSQLEDRWQARQERRANRGLSGKGWIGGAFLIMLGVILLIQNTGTLFLYNWWALFILMPAFGSFAAAWRAYQMDDNHLTTRARGSALMGLVFCLAAAIFLFNLDWMIMGPLLLILAGTGLFLNNLIPG